MSSEPQSFNAGIHIAGGRWKLDVHRQHSRTVHMRNYNNNKIYGDAQFMNYAETIGINIG